MKRAALVLMVMCAAALAQTTPPATQPGVVQPAATQPAATRPAQRSAEQALREMLQSSPQAAEPIKPIPDAARQLDNTTGPNAVAPGAPVHALIREGTMLRDRIGRLTKIGESLWEMTLESDGSTLADPPLVLLPNSRLSELESTLRQSYRDLKIRFTGEVTEYNGRNYLLLSRWSAVADVAQPLQ